MKIDLYEEMLVRLRRIGPRIARVPKAVAVGRPSEIAARGRILHARDGLIYFLPARHIVDVQSAVFAAVLRKRYGHAFAVGRGHVPINGGQAFAIDLVL